jgi:hypothetical protein
MKKVVIGFFVFLAILFAAAALVPLLFKDKIKQALDKEIAKNIDATVIYETDDVSLSLLRDFPNMSLGVDNLLIVGQDSFATDTLARIPSFRMGLDLMSVITGNRVKINTITLNDPTIRLLVLKSGKANWDIFISDTAATADTDTTASDFRMAIKKWEVNNGTLLYDDLSIPFGLAAYNVRVRFVVPHGSRLICTTPRAESGGGHLVWQLGKLSPGEDRTVEMQLMPTAEGEIGSVATVSYSAQASVKTRCTMPQLAIRMTAPAKVMIGQQQRAVQDAALAGHGHGLAADTPAGLEAGEDALT